jgi:hypothetical protein
MDTKVKRRKKLMAVETEIPPVSQLQLTFFPPTETEVLMHRVNEIKESSDKVRKGVFARHTKLAKLIDELTCRIDQMEKNIQNLGTLVTSAIDVPIPLDSPLEEESTPIIAASAVRAPQNKMSRQREIITKLYPTDLFEECK